jgi:hypothetical protein
MKELERNSAPRGAVPDETVWALMKDLAAVSRAQARLAGRLIEALDRLRALEGVQVPAPERPSGLGEDGVGSPAEMAALAVPPAMGPMPSPSPPVEPAVVRFGDERFEISVEDDATELRPGLDSQESNNGGPPHEEADVVMESALEETEESLDSAGDGSDESDNPDNGNAMILVLESGDVRVGVLWDQVVQIGSLSTSAVPERIETDHGEVETASLGHLLHGVSREEKYFVILEQDGERAGVACERMLGLGPLANAAKQEKDARIQVLKVPMLRTFAGAPKPAPKTAPVPQATRTPEEQDRQGPLRALVAVRYLPARVAICRHLRGRGWQVGEAAGLEAATVSLDLGRWDALFLEARSNGESDEVERALLRRVGECNVPVVRVGSRISGYPGKEGPALMFPFSEAELDTILVKAGQRSDL